MQWLRVGGRALSERNRMLEGEALYVDVRGSVHWEGVHTEDKNFLINY